MKKKTRRSERGTYNGAVHDKAYRKKHPWVTLLNAARTRCRYRSHKMFYRYGGRGIVCLLTIAEVRALWLRDNAAKLGRPSLDRKDENGNYTFENCRFIELAENIARAHRHLPGPIPTSKRDLRKAFAGSRFGTESPEDRYGPEPA